MSIDELGFLSPEIEAYRTVIRQRYAEYFDLIERSGRCCHAAKTKCEAHNGNGQEVWAIGLFLKILADVEGATLLLERGLTPQARSLLRVAIHGILAKICKEYRFARVYGMGSEQERLKLIKGIKNDEKAGYERLRKEFTDSLVNSIEEVVLDNRRKTSGNGQPMWTWLRFMPANIACFQRTYILALRA